MQMNGMNELITIAKYWRALERPAARRARAQQPRPEPGHVGAARARGRPALRGLAGHPRLPVRALRRAASASAASASTAPTDVGEAWDEVLAMRPAGRARGVRRPERAAAAAAHHLQAGQGDDVRARQGRPGPRRGHRGVAQGQARGVPAGRGRWRLATAIDVAVETLDVSAFTVPTDEPESDGTATWDSTTLVARRGAGRRARPGSATRTPTPATAALDRRDARADVVEGRDALAVGAAHEARCARRAATSAGPASASMAISAVDTALWDLKARLLDVPLAVLLGARARRRSPVYGSGGFTSYSLDRSCRSSSAAGRRTASRA